MQGRIPKFIGYFGKSVFVAAYQLFRLVRFKGGEILHYRHARVFFENSGNRDTLVNDGIVKSRQTVVMPGAGVNLSEFGACQYPSPNEPIRFLFVGRIMKEE